MVFYPIDSTNQPIRRRGEFQKGRFIEKVLDEKNSRGTNTVYKTGREFPVMFSTPSMQRKDPSKKK